MTRKKHETLTGLPKLRLHDERDLEYSNFKSLSLGVLEDDDLNACTESADECKRRMPKMLATMAHKLFENEEARELFFNEDVTSERVNDYLIKAFQQEESKARNLLDFLILSLKAQVEPHNTHITTGEHIRERIDSFLILKLHKWMNVLMGSKLTEGDEELKAHLIDKVVNVPALCSECWADMCKTKSMDIFCYFLRRLGVNDAGTEVKKIMDDLFFSESLKDSANEVINIVSQKRSEQGVSRRVRHETLGSIDVVIPIPIDDIEILQADGSDVTQAGEIEIPSSPSHGSKLVKDVLAILKQKETEKGKFSVEGGEYLAKTVDNILDKLEGRVPKEAEHAVEEPEFAIKEVERKERRELTTREKIVINIGLGVTAAVVLVIVGVLNYRQKKAQEGPKPKDKLAQKAPMAPIVADPASVDAGGPIVMDAAALPPHVKTANNDFKDAAVAQATPDAATPPPIPDAAVAVASKPDAATPPPIPKQAGPAVKVGPLLAQIQADKHTSKISLMSVNDLPANYGEKYKSLYLGEKIDLKGKSMTEYIQDAIKEIATPSQWEKYERFLKDKMQPGWLLYMAMQDDPWFEKVYKKKHKWQYRKAQKLLKKYNTLKDKIRKLEGKGKLSKRQQRKLDKYKGRLADYESNLKVGKSIMLSLGALNYKKDVNNLEEGYISKDGKVANIVLKIAKASDIEIPKVITADTTDYTNNGTMLADLPDHETIELDEIDYEIVDDDINPDDNPDTVQDTINTSAVSVASYDSHDPVKAGQELLKRVEAKEREKAKLNEERGIHMELTVDRILGKLDVVEPPVNSSDYGYSGVTVEHPVEEPPNDAIVWGYDSIEVEHPVEEPDPTVAVLDYDTVTYEHDNDDYDDFQIIQENVA